MRLKGHDRVCYHTSNRARVLPDNDEQEAMTVAQTGYTMIGRTRCDNAMMGFIKIMEESGVIAEEHAFNKVKFVETATGKSAVVSSTLRSESQYTALTKQLQQNGLLATREEVEQAESMQQELEVMLGGVKLSGGSGYLLQQFLSSLAADIEQEIAARSTTRLTELEELFDMAQVELQEIKSEQAREKATHQRELTDARQRAERAEKALSAFTTALRGAESIVSGS